MPNDIKINSEIDSCGCLPILRLVLTGIDIKGIDSFKQAS